MPTCKSRSTFRALAAFALLALFVVAPMQLAAQTPLDAASHPKFVNPLPIPARLNALHQRDFKMVMKEATQWLGLEYNGTPLMTTVWG